jgi:hypothetical protein
VRFLAAQDFSSVRLGVILKALEPEPGVFDDAYLEHIVQTVDLLERYGIVPPLDFTRTCTTSGLIAGTPAHFFYIRPTRTFYLSYTTNRAAGGRIRPGVVTEIRVPALDYPNSYHATVLGATIVSKPDGDPLLLSNNHGARSVSVTINRAVRQPTRPAPHRSSRRRRSSMRRSRPSSHSPGFTG